MRHVAFIWTFYKPYAIWSLAITALIGFFNPDIVPALLTKAFLTIFLWYLVNETRARRKLVFYKNFGISTFKLFATSFLIDSFITTAYLLVFKSFA